jgi:hypothetical protein
MRHADGDLAGAREAFDAVLARPDPAIQAAGPAYLGFLLEHGDRFAEARRLLDRGIEACRAAGLFRPMLTSCFAATLACANLGDLGGALDRLAMLERLLGEVDDRFYHARAATAGSWVWRELGDPGRAKALADRAVELLGPATTGTHPGLHAQLALAECALLAGDHGEAAALLELARTYGSTKYQVLALARLGRRPEAAELAAASGSDYLLAQVAPPAQARAAVDRIAASLPPELRPAFLSRGPLAAAVAGA